MEIRDISQQKQAGSRTAWMSRSAVIVAALSIIALGAMLHAAPRTHAAKTHARARAVETATAPVESYGSSGAPITMIVFTDYQCPSCRALYENTLRPMISDYVASGKVYLVHHNFPLPQHKYGYEAARWASAAARVGEFANVEAALYDNQDAWGASGDIAKYISEAMPASDFKRVEKLMQGCAFQDQPGTCPLDGPIEADRAMGEQIPVRATPTYVIEYKGRRLPAASGAVSWPILKQFFDSLLTQ